MEEGKAPTVEFSKLQEPAARAQDRAEEYGAAASPVPQPGKMIFDRLVAGYRLTDEQWIGLAHFAAFLQLMPDLPVLLNLATSGFVPDRSLPEPPEL